MEVTGARTPTAGECNCLRCSAPGHFRLHRDAYTLEFWNGDRWYPMLYVRARTQSGDRLTLSSPGLLPLSENTADRNEREFDYWVRNEFGKGTDVAHPNYLDISVLNAAGQVIGKEQIDLRVERRRDLSTESL